MIMTIEYMVQPFQHILVIQVSWLY